MKQARTLAAVSTSSATLVAIMTHTFSGKADKTYEQDLLDNPGQPDEAWANRIKGLHHEVYLACAIDRCNEAVTQLCRSLASSGLMARRGLSGCAPSSCA